jgi:hypothetical protein
MGYGRGAPDVLSRLLRMRMQPALTRLIRAYIKRCAAAIVGNQPLFHQILGLVQFLMMSKVCT